MLFAAEGWRGPAALIRGVAIRMKATMPEAPGRAHASSRERKGPARGSELVPQSTSFLVEPRASSVYVQA